MARQAIADTAWQRCARASLALDAARLAALLRDHGLAPTGGTALFQWVLSADAERIDAALAQQGVLARRFDRPASLRFGLPGEEQDWQRLSVALASAVHS